MVNRRYHQAVQRGTRGLHRGVTRPKISTLADRYRRDFEFRTELDFAFGVAGVPHSQILTWSDDDRQKLYMWELERRLACPECHTRLEEWEGRSNRHAYIPQTFICPGCAAAGDAMEAAQNNAKGSKSRGVMAGLKVRLIPKYVNDYKVKTRTPEQRARLMEQEKHRLTMEREGEAEGSTVRPVKATGLGGGRQPPVTPPKTLVNDPQSADE